MRYIAIAVVIALLLFVFYLLLRPTETNILEKETSRTVTHKVNSPTSPQPVPVKHPLSTERSEPDVTPAPSSEFDPSEYGSIVGRVVDEGDDGIQGARISATIKGKTVASAPSDADGGFELTYLPDGTYTLLAVKKGYADAVLNRLVVRPKERVEGILLRMVRGGAVEGRVFDDTGEPIPDAGVVVYPYGRVEGVKVKTARTNKEGFFRIEDLYPAVYRITASHPDCIRHKPEEVTITAQQIAEKDIILTRGGTVIGIVLNEEEKPVKGANIYLMQPSGMLHLGRSIMTDNEGRFTIRGLPPGTINLKITAKGYQTKTVEGITVIAGETSDETRIILSEGLRLEGVVVDENGFPIEGAYVSASTKTGILSPQKTDKEGFFRLSGLLPNDTVSLLVKAKGYVQQVRRNITLPVELLKIVLRKGAVLTGRLTSTTKPPKNFIVLCFRMDENGKRHLEYQKFINNSKDYNFTIKELPPAIYEIEVSATGYIRTEPVEVDLRSGNGDVTIFIEKRQ